MGSSGRVSIVEDDIFARARNGLRNMRKDFQIKRENKVKRGVVMRCRNFQLCM